MLGPIKQQIMCLADRIGQLEKVNTSHSANPVEAPPVSLSVRIELFPTAPGISEFASNAYLTRDMVSENGQSLIT